MVSSEVKRAIRHLESQIAVDQGDAMFKKALETIKSPHDWPLADLALLAPLANDCALNLSKGLGHLHAAKILLTSALANSRMTKGTEVEYRQKSAGMILRGLRAASTTLRRAGQEMSDAT